MGFEGYAYNHEIDPFGSVLSEERRKISTRVEEILQQEGRLALQKRIVEIAKKYEDEGKQSMLPVNIAKMLYEGAFSFYGYEPFETTLYTQEDTVLDLSDDFFKEYIYKYSYRSREALAGMVDLMAYHERNVGVMSIGTAHYPSLKYYAEKRGDVNVIFVRPNSYDLNQELPVIEG